MENSGADSLYGIGEDVCVMAVDSEGARNKTMWHRMDRSLLKTSDSEIALETGGKRKTPQGTEEECMSKKARIGLDVVLVEAEVEGSQPRRAL